MSELSDVRRGRRLAVVAAGAALATAIAVMTRPATPESASGALALPHAGIDCKACHQSGEPASTCGGCHGPHPSRRPAHQALARRGELSCTHCHEVHRSDQGVRFSEKTERYAVGRSELLEVPPLPFSATVPLVPIARCTDGCHRTDGSDPIARCVNEGRPIAADALNLCFDEHREALASGPEGGVCVSQHGPRIGAWEAARRVAADSPPPASGSSPAPWWLAAGGLGAGLAAIGHAASGTIAARRRRRRRDRQATALTPQLTVSRRLPVIDTSTCLGCYACVDACPYDVLRIDRYLAVVDRPEACCGLTLCEQSCPNGSLHMSDDGFEPEQPRLSDGLEALDVPGLYLAGDVTGVPLIKSAILQGRRVVDAVAASSSKGHGAPLDLIVIGAGPAGISAALRARELGLRARVIEQASVAQSIRSFPRGKLVYDQPLELPLAGKLWLERATKEELLSKWLRIVREERLEIDEDRRFVSLEREAESFVVEARDEAGRSHRYRAARVVLAVGTRGTPRKLPLAFPSEVADKVFYSLADARSFAGKRALVVGLGDVAMETAIALAAQPGSRVTIAYRGREIRRGKERNRREIRRLVEAGIVELLLETRVQGVHSDRVDLLAGDTPRTLENDVVFVMIGNLSPRPLLEGLGIRFRDRAMTGSGSARLALER